MTQVRLGVQTGDQIPTHQQSDFADKKLSLLTEENIRLRKKLLQLLKEGT